MFLLDWFHDQDSGAIFATPQLEKVFPAMVGSPLAFDQVVLHSIKDREAWNVSIVIHMHTIICPLRCIRFIMIQKIKKRERHKERQVKGITIALWAYAVTLVPTQHDTGHKCIMIHTPTPGVTLPRNTSKTHPNFHKNGSQAGPQKKVLVQCVAMVPTNDTNVFRIPGPRQSRLLSKGEEYCMVTSLRRCCFCPTAFFWISEWYPSTGGNWIHYLNCQI